MFEPTIRSIADALFFMACAGCVLFVLYQLWSSKSARRDVIWWLLLLGSIGAAALNLVDMIRY